MPLLLIFSFKFKYAFQLTGSHHGTVSYSRCCWALVLFVCGNDTLLVLMPLPQVVLDALWFNDVGQPTYSVHTNNTVP